MPVAITYRADKDNLSDAKFSAQQNSAINITLTPATAFDDLKQIIASGFKTIKLDNAHDLCITTLRKLERVSKIADVSLECLVSNVLEVPTDVAFGQLTHLQFRSQNKLTAYISLILLLEQLGGEVSSLSAMATDESSVVVNGLVKGPS